MDDICDSDPDFDMLLFDSPTCSQQSSLSAASEKVVEFIEHTFSHIYNELEKRPSEDVYVELERVPSTRQDSWSSGVRIKKRKTRYYWPGGTPEEAWRFSQALLENLSAQANGRIACVLAILLEVKKAIVSGTVVTKRDIYYRQPELFKSQATVDRWIDDIAFTCRVSRRDLMVTGSQKGLLCGLSRIDRVRSISQDTEQVRFEDICHVKWVLVIEKEASFITLVEGGFDRSPMLGPGLLVTGKGYPDLQTRFFLRHILDTAASSRSPIKLFGLFDGDPDGLEIYRCYHSGSQALAHETACLLPEIRWLGIDICSCLDKPEIMRHAVSLTPRDRSKACAMLARLTEPSNKDIRDQTDRMLQMMLMLGLKMEIQGFEKIDGGITNWLELNMAD